MFVESDQHLYWKIFFIIKKLSLNDKQFILGKINDRKRKFLKSFKYKSYLVLIIIIIIIIILIIIIVYIVNEKLIKIR